MSGPDPASPPDPGRLRCARCNAEVADEQDWCLNCGFPARTVVARTPRWRVPVALVATVAAVALAALAVAFVDLTEDPETVPAATTAPAPAPPPPPAGTTVQPPPAPPPAPAPAPPATAPAPPATAPAAPPPPAP